jgi:hypothetical protein
VWGQGVPPGGERAAQHFYPLNCEPLCGRNNCLLLLPPPRRGGGPEPVLVLSGGLAHNIPFYSYPPENCHAPYSLQAATLRPGLHDDARGAADRRRAPAGAVHHPAGRRQLGRAHPADHRGRGCRRRLDHASSSRPSAAPPTCWPRRRSATPYRPCSARSARPTHIEHCGTVVCVGGGIGVAPLYPIAQAMKAAGNRVDRHHGRPQPLAGHLRGGDAADRRRADRGHGRRLRGRKALVTEPLKELCERQPPTRLRGRHRAAGHDEVLRRDHTPLRHPDHRLAQHDHGRWHGHVRRLPRDGRRPDAGSSAWTAPSSTATRWISTT